MANTDNAPTFNISMPPQALLDAVAVCDLDTCQEIDRAREAEHYIGLGARLWRGLEAVALPALLSVGVASLVGIAVLVTAILLAVAMALVGPRDALSFYIPSWTLLALTALYLVVVSRKLSIFKGILTPVRRRRAQRHDPTLGAQRDLLVQVLARLVDNVQAPICDLSGDWGGWTLVVFADEGRRPVAELSVAQRDDGGCVVALTARSGDAHTPTWERMPRLAWAPAPEVDRADEGSRATLLLREVRLDTLDASQRAALADWAALAVVHSRAAASSAQHAAWVASRPSGAEALALTPRVPLRVATPNTTAAAPGRWARVTTYWTVAVLTGFVVVSLALTGPLAVRFFSGSLLPLVPLPLCWVMLTAWTVAAWGASALKHMPMPPLTEPAQTRQAAPLPAMTLTPDTLSAGTPETTLDLGERFTLSASRDPEHHEGRALVTFDLRQPAPQADAAPRRLRFAVPLARSPELDLLPALITDAPLLDPGAFDARVWPALLDRADALGVELPRQLRALPQAHNPAPAHSPVSAG